MNQVAQIDPAKAGELVESVIIKGDLGQLKPEERARYYVQVCESIGLNPLTQPFEYITLNGKLRLYARKDATDQLRRMHGVSVTDLIESERDGVYIVTCKVRDATGRTDAAKGAVALGTLKGEALANQIMKAETKAKRRATLSICGLGFLDETELETIPAAATLPKKDARGIYTQLQAELDDCRNVIQLQKWEAESLPRIVTLPQDWQDWLKLRAAEHRAHLQQMAEPEVWDEVQPPQAIEDMLVNTGKWGEMSPTQQAGILCNEAAFQRFVSEQSTLPAAEFVRHHCLVKSRADIHHGHVSGRLWRELVAEYRTWRAMPDITDSAATASNPQPTAADAGASVTPVAEAPALTEAEMVYQTKLKTRLQNAATTDAELRKAWDEIPKAWRKDPELIAVKDRLKTSIASSSP